MPLDVLGVAMLYPTKIGSTNSWFISNGFEDSPRLRLDEEVSGNNTSGFQLDDYSQVRFSVSADTQDVDIGCDANFAEAWDKEFVHKSNDWKNVEQTAFFNITHGDPLENEIILKGPTGEHHSNTDCCSGEAYNAKVGLENPVNFEFTKEMWHVNYHDKTGEVQVPSENYSVLNHGWFGMKYVHYIKGSGDNKTVKLEIWWNSNGDGLTWKKVLETEDTGGWGDGGDECGGESDQILAFGNSRMMYRFDWDGSDGSDLKFKNCSIREIDPFATFNENPSDPQNPPTNPSDIITFLSTLKLQRHVNYNDGIGCGLNTIGIAYDNIGENGDSILTNHATYLNRTRATEMCVNSSSKLVNIPKLFEVKLKRVGSPAGNVNAKIWSSTGVVRYTSPTALDADVDIDTSYNLETFDFSTNTYQIQVNDRIGVEYTGTSDTSYIVAGRVTGSYDGSNSTFNDWEAGAWDSPATDKDLAARIYKQI